MKRAAIGEIGGRAYTGQEVSIVAPAGAFEALRSYLGGNISSLAAQDYPQTGPVVLGKQRRWLPVQAPGGRTQLRGGSDELDAMWLRQREPQLHDRFRRGLRFERTDIRAFPPLGETKHAGSGVLFCGVILLTLSTAYVAVLGVGAFEWGEREVKILICDQQRMLAEALASALDARGYDILAVTTSVSDTPSSVGDWVPDVCLLGLQPDHQASGPDTVRAMLQRYPGTKVLVLSKITDPETLSQFMKSGVAGVTHQDQSVAQIAAALDAIEAGRNVLDPGPLRFPARARNRLCELSPREKEILTRIAAGQSTRQMSYAMNITIDTVRTYVKNVLSKLGAHSRLQLAALASRDGLLTDLSTPADVLPSADSRVSRFGRTALPEERAMARKR